MVQALNSPPERPKGVYPAPVVNRDFTKEYIAVQGYTVGQNNVLGTTIDDVEVEINLETYERMENDAVITKDKEILVTNVLADELQLAPGATEEEVSEEEYKKFVGVMEFCERLIAALETPSRTTFEQILGNAIRYGHGIAEIVWEYRMDGPLEKSPKQKVPEKSRFRAALSNMFSAAEEPKGKAQVSVLEKEELRLLPKRIMVKPRGSALFVVDEYMNVLGMSPKQKAGRHSIGFNEIIDRSKFLVLTLNKRDEDPRGRSRYRPAFNWFNLKSQLPAELLRFILQEAVPQAVATLPENMAPFEYVRDASGNIVYEDADKRVPVMMTAAESMAQCIKGFRSGSGAVIPFGASLKPFKSTTNSDSDLFGKVLKVIDDQIESAILLQTLAQSEGQHQSRSASSQVAELLYVLIFLLKWAMATMVLSDLLEPAVRFNFGNWAVKYLPVISFGDFVRRDWNQDLDSLSDAYFKGFLDDTQRAELMTWMNLPKAGPSRQETAAQVDPTTGNPVMPNKQRPDKQQGQNNRNDGNGTVKKNDQKPQQRDSGRGSVNALGHYGNRFVRSTRALFASRIKK